jgi:peptide subunit release factor 1 (eRF1)
MKYKLSQLLIITMYSVGVLLVVVATTDFAFNEIRGVDDDIERRAKKTYSAQSENIHNKTTKKHADAEIMLCLDNLKSSGITHNNNLISFTKTNNKEREEAAERMISACSTKYINNSLTLEDMKNRSAVIELIKIPQQ